MTTFALPTEPQTIADSRPDPLAARLYVGGPPKTGKTTLASQWSPATTLFLDLQHGTDLLPGTHYVAHVDDWQQFDQATTQIAAGWKAGTLKLGDEPVRTVVIDTIDLAYKYADAYAGARFGQIAAGLVEYGKGAAEAEGVFRMALSRLLSCRGLGIWFLGHSETVDEPTGTGRDTVRKLVPKLDKRVREYVIGEVEHQLIAERVGKRTILHTQASQRFEAGSRLPLPEPLDMSAHALYRAMQAGIAQLSGVNGATHIEPTKDEA